MTRTAVLLAALLAAAGLAQAQEKRSRAHMEGCLRWGSLDNGQHGAFNQCDSPIAIKFMTLRHGQVTEANVPARGRFDSGATSEDMADGMIFTACPVGYEPSVRFSKENAEPIAVSLYNCLPLGRPES